MKHHLERVTAAMLLTVLLAVSGCAYGGREGSRVSPPVRVTGAPGIETVGNGVVNVDTSAASQGYITVQYSGGHGGVRAMVAKGELKNYYDIARDRYGEYVALPLHAGSGAYTVKVYERGDDAGYTAVFSGTVRADMENELLPFLHPSVNVEYDKDSAVVRAAEEIARPADSDYELVQEIYNYVAGEITFDYALKAEVLRTGEPHIPDIEEVLSDGTGICIDYATVMTAMLRSQGIPTRVMMGRKTDTQGTLDHAWVSVYLSDGAWADGRQGWAGLDPTRGAFPSLQKALIPDDAGYCPVYYY
jgi:transglutaminase-like putative cysteine protease